VRKVGWSLVVLGLISAGGSYCIAMNDMAHVVHRDGVVAAMVGLGTAIIGLIIVQLRS